MQRKLGYLAGGFGGLVLLGGVAGGVTLASDDDSEDPVSESGFTLQEGETDVAGAFLDLLAENLGIDREALDGGIQQTANELLDEAEAEGDVPAEIADLVRDIINDPAFPDVDMEQLFGSLEGITGGEGGFELPGGLEGFGALKVFGPLFSEESVDDLAEFLGVSGDDLTAQLAEGQSLAAVAEANGVSRDELVTYLNGRANGAIDDALADGEIDQAEADELRAKAAETIEQFVDGELPFAFGDGAFALPGGEGGWEAFPGGEFDIESFFAEDGPIASILGEEGIEGLFSSGGLEGAMDEKYFGEGSADGFQDRFDEIRERVLGGDDTTH